MAAGGARAGVARNRRSLRPRRPRDAVKSFALTFAIIAVLAAFLSPMLRSALVSLKTPDQLSETDAPLLPSLPRRFEYQGKAFDIYVVPMPDGSTREMALVKPGRTQSTFVDPADASQTPVVWQGAWRTLDRSWELAPAWQ